MSNTSQPLSVFPLTTKQASLKDFQRIPGVGRQIAEDLWALGYRCAADLCGQDPEAMYAALCSRNRALIDRCMLYVFRCAVYFASTPAPDPDLLKWWHWKDVPQAVNE